MFDNLSDKLSRALKNIRGQGRLTEANIKDTLREVRSALLDADVAFPIVKELINSIRLKALGQEVQLSLNPGQMFIKIVNDELVALMGEVNESLNLQCQPPAVILMAGLQGSGKTTTVGKLARLLKSQKKSVLLTSCDIYRPAAIDQLKTIANQLEVDFFDSDPSQAPADIAKAAITHAKRQFHDVLLIDTAGRLHIDKAMMQEIQALHQAVQPIETLFIVDSMTGQDAANTAKAFHDALPLTGVILTKIDGDARGGAALSIRKITEKPIKFLGSGEKLDALEPFYPDRIASRILGMGDVLTLIEDLEKNIDQEKARKLAKKIKKGLGFNLNDFREQLIQVQQMGGMMSILEKIPGASILPKNVKEKVNEKEFTRIVAMINSMTLQEREFPGIINGSRKRRISIGSGTSVQDLNKLLKQFIQMQKIMKKFSGKGGIHKMLRGMQGMMGQGHLPVGMFPSGKHNELSEGD